jgi:hypothetical protein
MQWTVSRRNTIEPQIHELGADLLSYAVVVPTAARNFLENAGRRGQLLAMQLPRN